MNWFRTRRDYVDGWDVFAIDNRDFDGSHVDTIPTILPHKFPEFNQYANTRSRQACTIVNAVKDICYNYNIDMTTELVRDAIDYCVDNWWYVKGKGRSTPKAMQYVRKFFIERWVDAKYVRLRHTDPKLQEYKDKWYMVWCSFSGNMDYIMDYKDDLVVDGIDFKPRLFWHRTSMYWENRIWDSNYGRSYNDYKLRDLAWLEENWVFNKRYYVWVLPDSLIAPVEDLKRLKQMEIATKENIANNSFLWWLSNDEEYKDFLHQANEKHRAKLKDINNELNKINN